MPILKTKILGSEIGINYQKDEREKLIKIINQFKKRLNEFPQNGKINDKVIIFLSALKTEDELEENKKLLSNNQENIKKIKDQNEIISKLSKEIISLKNENDQLKTSDSVKSNNDLLIIKDIQDLEELVQSIQIKIKEELN